MIAPSAPKEVCTKANVETYLRFVVLQLEFIFGRLRGEQSINERGYANKRVPQFP